MRFPEFLYSPRDTDIAKAIILPQRVAQRTSNAIAAAVLTDEFGPVPGPYVCVITNLCGSANAGAAQTVASIRADILADAQTLDLMRVAQIFTTLVNDALNWEGEILLMPGESIQIAASFSAGAAANTLDSSFHGYLVPRANVQFGLLPP